MYIVQFDAIAALLTCINLYIFYNQKKVKDSLSSRFEIMLWVTLGSSVFSALSSLTINRPDIFSIDYQIIATTIFYLFHNALPFTVAVYALAITGKKPGSLKNKILFGLPFISVVIVILTNPLTRFVFYYDVDHRYHRGPGVLLLFFFAFCYFSYFIYLLITRWKTISPLTRLVFPMVFVLPLVAIVFENIFNPYGALLECFAASVAMLLLLYTIQNSGELVDGATGLFNRAAFIKHAGTLLENGSKFDVLLLSIQNVPLMRQVFDIGDLLRMSQSMSLFLSRQTGKTGTVFILENESFALLLNAGAAESEKQTLIQGIRERFDLPWTIGETEADISMLLCLLHCPDDAKGVIEIFDCLEQLLTPNVREASSEILRPENLNLVDGKREADAERALRMALQTGSIELLYQPIYSVAQARFVFAEAMLSLQTDDGRRIPQSELLRVAERTGLAQRLGLMIIDTACAFYLSLSQRESEIEHIQIRLSGAQCMQSDLARQVLAVIDAWHLDPRHICFQITETAAVHSPVIMSSNMKLLSEANIPFALDDYGSGYTDLGYIVELPFSLIKLDKSIIRAGFQSVKGRIILNSTIVLIKQLNRKIIAEGVETAEQAEILTALGCDYLQGYFFSRVVEGKDIKAESR